MSIQAEPLVSLGQELKRRRQHLGIDLTEISEATYIGVRFLKAIENNDFKSLPGGLFTRSFIRSYARYVRMDEDLAIRLYAQQTGQGEQDGYEVVGEELWRQSRSSMWANMTIALTVLIILIIGGLAGWHYWQRSSSQSNAPGKDLPTTLRQPGR